MKNIIAAVVLVFISVIFIVIGIFQFKKKGFLFNNAYIYASKNERKTMKKDLYYKQSGVVFCLIGIIFLIDAAEVILKTGWLSAVVIVVVAATVIYACASAVTIDRKNR